MSIEDLERELQITFHDSLLREWSVDLPGRVATFALDVWIGDPDAKEEARRELRRSAVLRLDGVQYLFVDPPDARYPYRDADAVQIDVCDPDPALSAAIQPQMAVLRRGSMWSRGTRLFICRR